MILNAPFTDIAYTPHSIAYLCMTPGGYTSVNMLNEEGIESNLQNQNVDVVKLNIT